MSCRFFRSFQRAEYATLTARESGFIKIGKIPIQGTQKSFRAQIED